MSNLTNYVNAFGFQPMRTLRGIRGIYQYALNYRKFVSSVNATKSPFTIGLPYPCLADRYETSGVAKGAYFHQDLYVAQQIFKSNPPRHVDVGSRVDGFVAHVAAFRELHVVDIRPLATTADNITFIQLDMMDLLPERYHSICESLSCLHALEHFGLGRYGDRIDASGHLLGLANLHKLLVPNGTLYLSVPFGPQRIEFDAHRIFSMKYLLAITSPLFELVSFAYVNDIGDLEKPLNITEATIETNFGVSHGCAIMQLRKIPTT